MDISLEYTHPDMTEGSSLVIERLCVLSTRQFQGEQEFRKFLESKEGKI